MLAFAKDLLGIKHFDVYAAQCGLKEFLSAFTAFVEAGVGDNFGAKKLELNVVVYKLEHPDDVCRAKALEQTLGNLYGIVHLFCGPFIAQRQLV